MKEMLFRGKRIDVGKWVEGFYFVATDIMDDNIHHYIIETGAELYPHGEVCGIYEVDPSTVGQDTGLTDKNGKKIFEGDIIIDSDFPDTRYVVYFNDAAYVARDTMTSEACWLTSFIIFGEITSQIIGNIHDNPKLLEVR